MAVGTDLVGSVVAWGRMYEFHAEKVFEKWAWKGRLKVSEGRVCLLLLFSEWT